MTNIIEKEVINLARWVIDAGHGGKDSGNVGIKGITEKTINLSVANTVAYLLKQSGQTVLMTRSVDEFIALQERADMANRFGANYFISIHHNGYNGKARGMEVFHSLKTPKSEAETLCKVVCDGMKQVSRGAKARTDSHGKDYYAVLRRTNMKAMIIEFAFLDNQEDYNLVNSADKLRAQGYYIALGLLKLVGGTMTPNFSLANASQGSVPTPKPNPPMQQPKPQNTQPAPKPSVDSGGDDVLKKIVDTAKSRLGKNRYTQNLTLRTKAGEGTSDCSGFLRWVYLKVCNLNIGANSAEQSKHGALVGDIGVYNLSKLQPGDIIFYKRDGSKGRPYGIGHVEMYIGNGQMIGHGSGMGPTIKPITSNRYVMARRYVTSDKPKVVKPTVAVPQAQPKAPDVNAKKSKYFKDVPSNHWAIDVFDRAKEIGLISGTGDGLVGFSEQKGETVAMILNLYDILNKK